VTTLPGMPHLGTYRIISADPPWAHLSGHAAGSARAHYDEMSIEDLCAMPVGHLAHPRGALLLLWCTGPQAADGAHIEVAKAWGFRLTTRAFVWIKTTPVSGEIFFGPGSYTGQNAEDVWLGVRGDTPWSSLRARRDVRSVIMAPRGVHSEKPEEMQNRVESLWPTAEPRLELFARRRRPGWACWGNELEPCDNVFGDAIGKAWPCKVPVAPAVRVGVPDEVAMFGECP
jgi:N6-adenosine-specific RNA methylase IME4